MEEKIEERRRKKKKEEERRRKKKEEERRRKKKKNCQAHVTVLRTCSMSYGWIYEAIIDRGPIYATLRLFLWGLNILVQGGGLGQNKSLFITVILIIDYGNMVHLVII